MADYVERDSIREKFVLENLLVQETLVFILMKEFSVNRVKAESILQYGMDELNGSDDDTQFPLLVQEIFNSHRLYN